MQLDSRKHVSGKTGAIQPRLCRLIERLAAEERPALVRGDSAFGNQGVMGRDGAN